MKCASFNSESDLMAEVETLYLETAEGYRPFLVERVEPHDEYWRIKFKGIENPETARKYRGHLIALPREELPELPQGETYLEDLLGFQVLGPEGEILGRVLAWETVGSSEVFLVGENLKSAHFIPYRREFVKKTDMEAKKFFLTPFAMELLNV